MFDALLKRLPSSIRWPRAAIPATRRSDSLRSPTVARLTVKAGALGIAGSLASGLVAALALAACDETPLAPPDTGQPDTAVVPDTIVPEATPETEVTPEEPTRPAHCTGVLSPGPAPLRRLTKTEYNNTVRDLLGDDSRPADAFPPEETTLGFDNNASGRGVSQIHIERYMLAAEQLVTNAMANHRDLIIPCDPHDIPADLCASRTIERFGKLAFRRSLTADEKARFQSYFETLYVEDGFDGAIATIFEMMLQSPHFLYRAEVGEPDTDNDGVVALTGPEIATRLSYLVWNSGPDDILVAAGETGVLSTPEGIRSQVLRMLEDPRAHEAVLHFHRQWLDLLKLQDTYKDTELYPEFDESLKARLREETERFIDHVVWEGEGDLTTLLSASYSILDPVLAEHYGAEYEMVAGERPGFKKVALDSERRAGLFTQGAIMSVQAKYNQTSPVLRGKFVREQMLCQHLAPPPANINITPPDLDPNLTTRERFRQHNDSDECSGCHKKMDPLGLTFEHYDPIGRWRDEESPILPIDASGEILFTWDVDGPVANAVEMAKRLATSEEVQQCYATQWFRYTHGRDASFADECNVYDLMQAFEASGWNIKALIVALTQTEAFRYRKVIVPGGEEIE